jgi:hypothetical protein
MNLAMRAATRERMISIMAEVGLAAGLSANRKLPRNKGFWAIENSTASFTWTRNTLTGS